MDRAPGVAASDSWIAALGLYAVVGGTVSLAGWALDLPRLTDWFATGISIQPNASLVTICAGLALVSLTLGRRRVAFALGVLVAVVGAATLAEHLSGVALGIDDLLLFGRGWGERGALAPGRMGPPGSICWTLIGIALALAAAARPTDRLREVVPSLALVTSTMAGLSIIGYLYGVETLYALPTMTIMAFQTATFILSTSLGILLSIPGHGPARFLHDDSPAGLLVRRIMPAVIVVPVILGYLRLAGSRAGFYGPAFGAAIRTIAEIALLTGLLWWTAGAVSRQSKQRRQAESLHEASERRLRNIFETVAVSLWEVDFSAVRADIEKLQAEGVRDFPRYIAEHPAFVERARAAIRVLDVNDTTVAMFGADDKAHLMRSLRTIWAEGTNRIIAAELVAFAEGRSYFEAETTLRTVHGQPVRAFITMTLPAPGQAGQRVLASVVDLTERQRVEESLRESQQRIVDTLESMTDGFVTLDREWRYGYVNAEAERLIRRPRAELVGRRIWDLFPETRGSPLERELHRVVERQMRVDMEDYNPVQDRWFSSRAYPTPDGGVAIYFHEVTATKHAQEELARSRAELEADLAASLLLQRVSAEIIPRGDVTTLFGKITEAAVELMESQFATMHALDPGGASLRLLSAQDLGAAAIRAFATLDVSQRGTFGPALRLGERVLVSDIASEAAPRASPELQACLRFGIHTVQSTPLVSRSGRMLGVLSTYWDAPFTPSERQLRLLDVLARQAADLIERGEAEATLLQADRRKDEFLATLAHELRNPLAPMRTAIDLMKLKRPPDADTARARDIIDRQLAHMTRLLDDLLDVSRIARGKLSLRRERVDLCGVVRNALESCAPLVERMEHDLAVELPPRPVWVNADPVRLCQVLGNLLNNACRYTKPRGHLRLEVAADGAEVAIAISDSGIGIAPEEIGAIFDIFSQIGDTDSTQNGLGIGLYLVRQIVGMHDGRVEATSPGIGQGSRFVVRLPVLEPAARPQRQHQEDGAEEAMSRSSRP